jgi:hypothetical protein
MTRSDLLEVAHRFYPRGLFHGLPGYQESEERARQREIARRAVAGHPTWKAMLRRLGARYSFMDHSECMQAKSYLEDGDFDPAYSGSVDIPGRTLGFHVCLLGPYYGIHRMGAVGEEPAALDIAREIEAAYPGFEPIPPELGNEVVPDIIARGTEAGRSTIYHCLFSPWWELSSWADGDDLGALARARGLIPDAAPRRGDDGEDDPGVRHVARRIG